MRKAKGILGVVVGLMLLFHAGGTVAVANDPGGNNGTIKIHEGATENEPIRANDPHVCTFHIHGFNFDSNSKGTWWIDQQAPTGTAAVSNGAWSADGSGDWRTNVMSLPPGHYKAHAEQTTPNAPGNGKQKVFWVECGQSTTGGGTTSGTTTGTTTGTTGGTSGGSTGGTTGGEQASLSGTQSRSKNGGSKSGTKSKSKGGGSATGTNSQSKNNSNGSNASNTAGSVNGTDNTGSMSDHGEATTTGGTTTTGTSGGGTGNSSGNANGNGTGGQGNVTGGNTDVGGQGNVTGGEQNLPSTSQAGGGVAASGASPSIQILPSTSVAGDSTPLAIFGGFLVAFGAFMLRKPRSQQR